MDGHAEDLRVRSIDEGTLAQVLARLDDMKADILREVGTRLNSLEVKIYGKLESVQSDVQRNSSRGRITSGTSSRGSTGVQNESDGRIRFLLPDAAEVTDLDLVAVKDDAWLPAMRILMMYTIMAFAQLCPGASPWVTDKMKKYYAPALLLLDRGVSGLSMVFFSVVGDDAKSRYSSKLGALWSTMYTNIMVTMMMNVRTTLFGSRPIPAWLQSFGDIHSAYEYVKSVNEVMEVSNTLPLQRENSRASKRQRRAPDVDSAQTTAVCANHPLRPQREVAVRAIRSAVLRVLSDGRLKARLHIYKSVLFVAEEVAKYPSKEAARDAGFELELGAHEDEDEKDVPGILSGIWKSIPKANVTGSENGERANENALKNLAADFPSLKVRMVCKREIVGMPRPAQLRTRRRTGGSSGDALGYSQEAGSTVRGTETSTMQEGLVSLEQRSLINGGGQSQNTGTAEYFNDEEEFSLHTVALGLFVETFMMKEWPMVLRSSPHSIRAVHIFAVALRGLILKVLKVRPSSMEEKALGDVVFRLLGKNDTCATVFVGNRHDAEKERKTLDIERNKKFKIPYHEYIEKKRQIDEARARDAMSTVHQDIEEENEALHQDFDVSWMEEDEGDDSGNENPELEMF